MSDQKQMSKMLEEVCKASTALANLGNLIKIDPNNLQNLMSQVERNIARLVYPYGRNPLVKKMVEGVKEQYRDKILSGKL